MRVELIYAPGCSTYKRALEVLETIIAEERLPIAIEKTEEGGRGLPLLKINGCELSSGLPCGESVRSVLSQHWKSLTLPA